MGAKIPSVESVFGEAIEIDSKAERAEYLDRACGDDASLRRKIESLLEAHDRAGSFLQPDTEPDAAPEPPPLPDRVGETIGPYKLLEAIGEGGMGVVYMADQQRPVRRKVALKLIKPGMDSRQIIARFEVERQALAMMDHPNIARVHDAGSTADGRPYFVMELVRGLPITEYCDREQLGIRERLELFVLVCRAVQHAHQKGIIHRDLKPSNVLVTVVDGAAVPKVIDFGIAKAVEQDLTEKTCFTAFAQLVGTPLYMSPEQAEVSGVDVDTRSDVYSLGVLLYELLTGTTPFEPRRLQKAAIDEMRRILREEEPPRPSTRLSSLGESRTTVSANRKSEPRRLDRTVRGELDWIVMKALEKDRKRRYETANDFAADLMRHLTGQPVEACPPSAWYRLRKNARRNRTVLIPAILVAVALAAGAATSAWQAVRATRAGVLAEEKASEARAAAEESKAVLEFLVQDLLGATNPERRMGRDVKVAEVLGNAEKKIDAAFSNQPLVEAGVRKAMGSAFLSLGRFPDAIRHFSRAFELRTRILGPEHVAALESASDLAAALRDQGELEEARKLDERTLEIRSRLLGPEHTDVLRSLNSLAIDFAEQGEYEKAQTLFERLLEMDRRTLGPEHPNTLIALHNVGTVLSSQRKLAEARPLLEQAVELRRRILGPKDALTLTSIGALASLLREQSKYAEARPMFETLVEAAPTVFGPEHPKTLTWKGELAGLFTHERKLEEARKLLETVVEAQGRTLGFEHPISLIYRVKLAVALQEMGELDEARRIYERDLEIVRRTLAPGNPVRLNTMSCLAELLLKYPLEADHIRAAELAREVAAAKPGDQLAWKWLGAAEYLCGNWNAAAKAEEKCIEVRGDSGWAFQHVIIALSLSHLGKEDLAREYFEKVRNALASGGDAFIDTPSCIVDEARAILGIAPGPDAKPHDPPGRPTPPNQ
jgi:serine/threonine protein kinase